MSAPREDVSERRWEAGIDHRPESEALVQLLADLDDPIDRFNLKMGGDGDPGEDLAYYLDELIETGAIVLTILHPPRP